MLEFLLIKLTSAKKKKNNKYKKVLYLLLAMWMLSLSVSLSHSAGGLSWLSQVAGTGSATGRCGRRGWN